MHDTVGDKTVGRPVFSVVYGLLSSRVNTGDQAKEYILRGIGSIAPGRIPIPCARRDVL